MSKPLLLIKERITSVMTITPPPITPHSRDQLIGIPARGVAAGGVSAGGVPAEGDIDGTGFSLTMNEPTKPLTATK